MVRFQWLFLLRFGAFLFFISPVFLGSFSAWGQKAPAPGSPPTLLVNALKAPFYHGVASGDPLANQVMIWTRLTTNEPTAQTVQWTVAKDPNLAQTVRSGTAEAKPENDYTIKIDVDGLEPNQWYYYRFSYRGRHSVTGRTRTLPVGETPQWRMAVAACVNLHAGYWNAYRTLALRNDIDAVLHLGDYLYEYYTPITVGEPHAPAGTLLALEDYRLRHAQYKLNPDLQLAHQQLPFIMIHDDHEIVNNCYKNGSENHNNKRHGSYEERKAAALKAYFEWTPIRPNPVNPWQVYRNFKIGSLIDLNMLDDRLAGRDSLMDRKFDYSTLPNRTMLGETQRNWLFNELSQSKAAWRIIGQQVMMSQLIKFGYPLNNDQWDGYPADRKKIIDYIHNNNIQNVLVLSADIHTAWANDIYENKKDYRPGKGKGSKLVEFVAPSISARNAPRILPAWFVTSSNPQVRYVNLWDHGYLLVDVNKDRIQGDWYFVKSVKKITTKEKQGGHWYVAAGTRFLKRAKKAAVTAQSYPALAPESPNQTAELETPRLTVWNHFPNPVGSRFLMTISVTQPCNLVMKINDAAGKTVSTVEQKPETAGHFMLDWGLGKLPQGVYYLQIDVDNGAQTVVKELNVQ